MAPAHLLLCPHPADLPFRCLRGRRARSPTPTDTYREAGISWGARLSLEGGRVSVRCDTCHGRGWEGWTCSHAATPGPLHGSGCLLAWLVQGLWPEGQRDGRLTYLGSWRSSLPPRAWLTRGTRICLRRKRAGGLRQYLGWSPHAALPPATVNRQQRYSRARPSGLSSRVLLWTRSHLCPPVTRDTRVNNAESSAAGTAPCRPPALQGSAQEGHAFSGGTCTRQCGAVRCSPTGRHCRARPAPTGRAQHRGPLHRLPRGTYLGAAGARLAFLSLGSKHRGHSALS